MTQRKQILTRIALFLVPALLFVAGLFLYPLDKLQGYYFCNNDCYDKGTWNYSRVCRDATPVDIAFIGSSRTSLGIMETAVEDSLKKMHLDAHAANLGHCRWGRNMDYATAKMLFAHKKPKYLVLELHEEEERLGHLDFGYVADAGDVLMPVLFFNQNYFSDVYKALVVRFDVFKHKLLQDKRVVPVRGGLHGYVHFGGVADSNELNRMVINERSRKHYEDSKAELWLNKQYPNAYLRKICALAGANNCKVVFIYIPGYCSLPPKDSAFAYYRQFGAVLVTPQSILTAKQNWRDADHFNDNGAEQLSEWLTGELRDAGYKPALLLGHVS